MCVDIYVPRAKHPVKVHIWAGISLSSNTGISIFSAGHIKTLLPFLHDVFPSQGQILGGGGGGSGPPFCNS